MLVQLFRVVLAISRFPVSILQGIGNILLRPVKSDTGEADVLSKLGRRIPGRVALKCHPSDYPSCTQRLLEDAEDFCPFPWAFATHLVAVFGESRIIKTQWIPVGFQMIAHTIHASNHVIYITSYETQKNLPASDAEGQSRFMCQEIQV